MSRAKVMRQTLKNRPEALSCQKWCIPTGSPVFVCCLEDVLDLYAEPFICSDPCFTESPNQLVRTVRTPLPSAPEKVAFYDSESKREGHRNLFVFWQLLAGWCHLEVTVQHTKACMRAAYRPWSMSYFLMQK